MPLLLCNEVCDPAGLKGSGDALYEVSSEKDGGAGARGMRYDGSEAGIRGDGYDVRRDKEGVSTGLTDAIEAGREGKSWESRSDPEVFCRIKGGRACDVGVPLPNAGDPARRAVGTWPSEVLLAVTGEPTCSGEGTSSMAVYCATLQRAQSGSFSAGCEYPRTFRQATLMSPAHRDFWDEENSYLQTAALEARGIPAERRALVGRAVASASLHSTSASH